MSSPHDPTTPDTIYHVVQLSVWNKAKAIGGDYFPPTYADDGFIHATHEAKLLLDVLNHFYKEVKDDFLCLALDTKVLTSPVKMEAPAAVGNTSAAGGPAPTAFPHIYGALSPITCVIGEHPVTRTADGAFVDIQGL